MVGAVGGVNFKTSTVMIIAKIASKNVSNRFVFINIPLYFLIYILKMNLKLARYYFAPMNPLRYFTLLNICIATMELPKVKINKVIIRL